MIDWLLKNMGILPVNSPDSNVLEHVAVDLKTTFEAIARGQLEVVPPALERVRGQLISAFKRP